MSMYFENAILKDYKYKDTTHLGTFPDEIARTLYSISRNHCIFQSCQGLKVLVFYSELYEFRQILTV
jgi:hypothetical protein